MILPNREIIRDHESHDSSYKVRFIEAGDANLRIRTRVDNKNQNIVLTPSRVHEDCTQIVIFKELAVIKMYLCTPLYKNTKLLRNF